MKTSIRRRGIVRFLSLLTALCMLLGLAPAAALAEESWDFIAPGNSWHAIKFKGNYYSTSIYPHTFVEVDVQAGSSSGGNSGGYDITPDKIRITGQNLTNYSAVTEEGQTYEVSLYALPRTGGTWNVINPTEETYACDIEISNSRNYILKVDLYDFGVPDPSSTIKDFKKIRNLTVSGNVQVVLHNSSVGGVRIMQSAQIITQDGTMQIENTVGSTYLCDASVTVIPGKTSAGYSFNNTEMLDDCDVTVGRRAVLTMENSAGLDLQGCLAKSITVSHNAAEPSNVVFRNITMPKESVLTPQSPCTVSLINATTMGQLIFDGQGASKSVPYTLALNNALVRESVTVKNYGTLTISLAGENLLDTYTEYYDYTRGNRPDIMVANDSTLIIQDDPAQADVGSLAIGDPAIDPYSGKVLYYNDAGHYYCAAIGGTPAFEPQPHGTVVVKSGVLTAQAQYGGAAIGGSKEKPWITYLEGTNVIDEENSTPGFTPDAGTVRIEGGIVNVTATGGGAAIGGADGGDGGTFTITGGTVNATASMGAAAIGGGAWKFLRDENYNFVIEQNSPVLVGGAGGTINIFGGCVVNCRSENNYYTLNGLPKDSYSAAYNDLDALENGYADYGYMETRGYVIGASAKERMRSSDQIFIYSRNGATPVVMLQQNVSNTYMGSMGGTVGENDAKWDYFMYPDLRYILDTESGEGYYPTNIGEAIILLIGREFIRDDDGNVINNEDELGKYVINTHAISGWNRNGTERGLWKNNYKVRGVIPLPTWPDPWYSDERFTDFTLPEGSTITLLSGAVMNVASGFMVHGTEDQLVVEDGAVIQGRGIWPGKPAIDPNDTPNDDEVKDLLEYLKSLEEQGSDVGTENAGANSTARTIVTHLGVAKVGNGDRFLIPGDSMDEINAEAENLHAEVLTIINAGYCGFRKDTSASDETWRLLISNQSTSVSLLENSALSMSQRKTGALGVSVVESNGTVTITGTNAKLASPDYTVYESKANNPIVLTFSPEDDEEENSHNDALAFVVHLDPADNDAVFSVPNFLGSSFKLETVAPLKDKCALRFGGTLNFHTPVANFADVEINQLQINYGGGVKLGGIEGGGEVHIPEFGGFPVSGGAELHLNTFGGEQEYSLSLELETPIFEGAFEASFKEARGVVLPDTLYAELAVGEGGIPLVPPTVIGYLQGGGLGFSGLADTVAMDSFGAPPIRLKIAAKGSLFDVIDGWIDLSVGPSGFDLGMRDIEIKGLELIKSYSISAWWDAGTRKIHDIEYWGVNANMNQNLEIALGYHDKDVLTAQGSMGFGGFTGYKLEGNVAHVIIQFEGNAKLQGSLQIPAGIVGPLPCNDIEIANAEVGLYMAAGAANTIYGSNIQGASAMKILRELVKNTKPYFDAAVGAKAVIGGSGIIPTCHIRVTYVFGDRSVNFSGGRGEGDDLDLGGLFNVSETPQQFTNVSKIRDAATGDEIPAIYEVGAVTVASTRPSAGINSTGGGEILLSETNNGFDATVQEGAIGKVLIAINAADASQELNADNLTVTHEGNNVELVQAVYDENYELVNGGTANFFAGTGVAYFAPIASGVFTVTSSVALDSADAIWMVPFAELSDAVIGDASASYSVADANEDHCYKVQLFLGEAEGESTYLLAEKELSGAASYSGVFDNYSLTGGVAPTGTYYPSVVLLEYVAAVDENGETVETWSPVDRRDLTTTVAYTNNVAPDAPENVTLAYSGNETMTAAWSAVENADSYQISVYDEDGNDTGLLFQVNRDDENTPPATTAAMDLSTLETGKSYTVGVKAQVMVDGNPVASVEGRSTPLVLSAAQVPQIDLIGNIAVGEGGLSTFSVGAAGGSFTVVSNNALDYSVVNNATGAVVASAQNTTSITVGIGEDDNSLDGATLLIVATDPTTLDYAVQYVSVNHDVSAPTLVLDNLGVCPLTEVESGYITTITGNAESGALVLVWEEGNEKLFSAARANEDGSFSISLNFEDMPTNQIYIRAKDAAENLSDPVKVNFRDDEGLIAVSFDPNGADAFCATAGVKIAQNTPIGALPTAYWVDDVYLFDGWYTEAEGGVQITAASTFTEDTILYAHWADGIRLSFEPGDGECDVTATVVKSGVAVGTLPVPVYEGMLFIGWFTTESGGVMITEESTFTSHTTLYAHWSEFVTVTFDAGLGSCAVETMQVPKNGTIAEYPVPTARGYDFEGWYNDTEKVTGSTVFTEDLTLTANWTRKTAPLSVTQEGCNVGETLPDPIFEPPTNIVGEPTISYKGRNGETVVYQSSAKPTAAGSYTVTVQCDTFEQAYVGSADFVIRGSSYDVIIAETTGGTVAANVDGSPVTSAAEGETVTLTVTPDPGYALDTLTVTDENDNPVPVIDDAFTMPAASVTVTATFVRSLADGFYLIGPNWTVNAIDPEQKFAVNPGNGNEYMLSTTLAENDEIKVVHVTNNTIDAWYPDGEDTQYHVDAAYAGRVNIYFQTTYNDAWSAFGGYFYIEKGPEPEFKTQSLTLDGKIGVNFFMDLSGLSDDEKEASYMTFEISGAGEVSADPVPFNENSTNETGTYYGFSCYVTSIQMADTITATFHYGDGLTITKDYSIKQYIETFEENENLFDDETVALVHALADYGHYVQEFLADQKSWDLGEGGDYAEMDTYYAEDYIYDNIVDDLLDKAIYRDLQDENIVKASYTVILDSDTAIRVYFKPTAGFDGNVSAKWDNEGQVYLERESDGRYMVEIANIPAHLLGETHEIYAFTGDDCFSSVINGKTNVRVSVMSYVYSVLTANAYANNVYIKNAVSSLYAYWQAARAYMDAHPEN